MLERLAPRWIDEAGGVRRVADQARRADRLALDTEADSLHSYFHKVCLIQASVNGDHFLIDPLALGKEGLAPLFDVLADPAIDVLMHGADYDVRVLDRDYGARIHGLQDSQIMAQLLGEPRTGLAALLEKELGVGLDKKFQRADWGRRPLPPGMLGYAAADTAFLPELHRKLRRRLEDLGRWGWAEEEFRKLERVRHQPHEPDPLGFERIKGARRLKGPARDRAYTLFLWRDRTARSLDVPPFKVLGNRQLLELAETAPKTLEQMSKVEGIGPRFLRRWGRDVLRVLSKPEAAPPRQRGNSGRTQLDAAQRRRLRALTAARDAQAERLALDPGLLCPRAVLEALAACSVPTLAGCGLDGWRREILERPFRDAVAAVESGE